MIPYHVGCGARRRGSEESRKKTPGGGLTRLDARLDHGDAELGRLGCLPFHEQLLLIGALGDPELEELGDG